MANNIFPAVALIGGTDGALDKIDGDGLANGDGAIVITSSGSYIYRLDSTSGEAESSPDIISPDSNAGDKRWILTSVEDSVGFVVTAAGKALLDDTDASTQRETLGLDAFTIGVAYESAQLPGDGAIINVPRSAKAFTIPASLNGAYYDAATGPTAEVVVSLRKNGTEFATMTVAIGATSAVTLSGTETSFSAGDKLSVVFPTQDATWAGVSLSINAIRG